MSVIGRRDYEPPETATPELDDELTEVDGDCTPVEVAVLLETLVVDDEVVPGIV